MLQKLKQQFTCYYLLEACGTLIGILMGIVYLFVLSLLCRIFSLQDTRNIVYGCTVFLLIHLAILSPAAALEFKWNISCNIKEGIDNNLPHDNPIEIIVKALKELLKSQGTNMSLKLAQLGIDLP